MVRPADEIPREPSYRFTAEELERMVAAGLFPDRRIELIEGEIYVTPPQDPQHASVTAGLAVALGDAFEGCHLRTAMPLDCGEQSLPEPDLAVAAGAPRDYALRHPNGAETVLVVEVTRTSHVRDQRKAGIYAAAGAPVYWILDLAARRLMVHTEPGPEGYGVITILDERHAVRVGAVDVLVTDLLPPKLPPP